jgi:hypothetical protein
MPRLLLVLNLRLWIKGLFEDRSKILPRKSWKIRHLPIQEYASVKLKARSRHLVLIIFAWSRLFVSFPLRAFLYTWSSKDCKHSSQRASDNHNLVRKSGRCFSILPHCINNVHPPTSPNEVSHSNIKMMEREDERDWKSRGRVDMKWVQRVQFSMPTRSSSHPGHSFTFDSQIKLYKLRNVSRGAIFPTASPTHLR